MAVTQETQLARAMREALCNQTIAIRDRRRVVEQKWLISRRAWMAAQDLRYKGSDTEVALYNIPAARRIIERAVTRCVKMLTPKVKWFEVAPMAGSDIDQQRLSNVDAFLWYVIRKRIKSRSIISQLVRCMILYGMPVLKTSVTMHNGMIWPTQRAVDPFSWYIYPETVATIDDAEDIFEDYLFSFERYQTYVQRGMVEDIKRSDLGKPDWPYHLIERLAYQGITDPTANVDQAIRINQTREQLEKTTNAFVSMTEKWIRYEGSLYQVYIVWNHTRGARIVGFFKSRYDDPMYRMAIHRPLPGETYTNTQTEDIAELDILQNDMFNQYNNAVDREQGLFLFGGSSNMRLDSYKIKGGAKWNIGSDDPRTAVQFVQFPVTSTNQLRAWQIANGYMNSLGGAGTIAEGQPGRNMPRAGFAVNNLINLGMTDIQDVAEVIEQEVLTPGLSDIYKVCSLIPDDQLMRIPGGSAFLSNGMQTNILRKQDISGDFEFEWIGSLQFQDDAERAQRLLIFLQMALTTPLMQQLEMQGHTLNLPELIQTIWRSGIGERSLSKVVITLQQMQQQMMQTAQQGGQSPIPPDVMQLIQSVKQQATGGTAQQNGVPGMKPTLPAVTNGFIKQ